MIAVERLCNKLQEIFGDGFKIIPFAQLNTQYTTAYQVQDVNGNIGYAQKYLDEYTLLRQQKIVGVVNLQRPQRINADFYYLTSDFKIDFSVPTNVVKKDENGVTLESPEINFFTSYENALSSIINKTIEFDTTYRGKMVIGEPVYTLMEKDGEYDYAIYSVTGTFILTDKASFGSDYKVELKVNGAYVEIDGINSYVEMLDNGNNAIVVSNTTKTAQNLSQLGWVCTINIDDYETTNLARKLLFDIIHENIEIINAGAPLENLKRKIMVKVTSPYGNIHEFYAIVNITFKTNKNNGGSYDISFTDDNVRVQYTLEFDTQGGGTIASKNVKLGEAIGALSTPEKTGYTFTGWKIGDKDITSNTLWDYLGNKTAYAQWQINTYILSFESEYGEIEPIEIEYNSTIPQLPSPQLPSDDLYFVGWKIDGEYIRAGETWLFDEDKTANEDVREAYDIVPGETNVRNKQIILKLYTGENELGDTIFGFENNTVDYIKGEEGEVGFWGHGIFSDIELVGERKTGNYMIQIPNDKDYIVSVVGLGVEVAKYIE